MQRRLTLLASAAVLTIGLAGTANAGPNGHFAGFNMGVDIGWAHVFGQIDDVNPNYANTSGFQDVDSADGFLLGGHLGYDWQFSGNWLLGLELGVQSVTAEDAPCGAAGCSNYNSNGNPALAFNMKGVATGRLRVGYVVMPQTLLYVGGGIAVAEVETIHNDEGSFHDNTTRNFTGWTVAGGVQHAINDSTDLRLDIAYEKFSDKHWTDPYGESFGAEPELLSVSIGAVWHLD